MQTSFLGRINFSFTSCWAFSLLSVICDDNKKLCVFRTAFNFSVSDDKRKDA